MPRVNTLLIGSDAGKDRWGTRTDSLMVVSTNTKTGDTLLVGIPRNLERVPIPESNPLHTLYPNGYDCGDECLMNGIWTLAEGRPDLFPGVENPGRQSTVDVVGEITGLQIDQSVVINLKGFRALVDAMGGVDVNVQERVCVECHTGTSGGVVFTGDKEEWIEPGLQHLDGRRALWYSRSRAGSDDFSRMRRQRCVAGALIEQADPVSLLRRYPELAKVIKNNVSIDIPASELPAWVDLVLRIQKGDSIRSLPLTSKVVEPGQPRLREDPLPGEEGPQAAPGPLAPPERDPVAHADPERRHERGTEPDADPGRRGRGRPVGHLLSLAEPASGAGDPRTTRLPPGRSTDHSTYRAVAGPRPDAGCSEPPRTSPRLRLGRSADHSTYRAVARAEAGCRMPSSPSDVTSALAVDPESATGG